MLQEEIGGKVFLGNQGELNIIILHFLYIYSILQARPFWRIRMHQIRFSPGLCPECSWESPRCSPKPSSRLGRGTPWPSPFLIPWMPTRLTL